MYADMPHDGSSEPGDDNDDDTEYTCPGAIIASCGGGGLLCGIYKGLQKHQWKQVKFWKKNQSFFTYFYLYRNTSNML
jgi:hypothetical protein